jgi:SAM-dependent methyltransferase
VIQGVGKIIKLPGKTMMRGIFLTTATIMLGCLGMQFKPALAQSPSTHQHSFAGAQKWAREFDDPKRDAWQKPHEVIQELGLKSNSVIADIGSGTGYFTVRLAHFVPAGRVYGVDTEPDMVKYLSDRAKGQGLKNVTALAGKLDSAELPVKVDLIFMVDVFHHLSNRRQYFMKLKDSLKPGGRIAIIDFNEASPIGPPPSERIPAGKVKAELSQAGYTLAADLTFLPNQYFLIFKSANR